MVINKKIKCQHCETIIEQTGKCTCEKVRLVNGIIVEGVAGVDYIDISAQLLNE
jgi:hypothetical protein